jgi:hypothetical protein
MLALKDVKVMLTADDPCPCGERDEKGLPYKRGGCCEQEWSKVLSFPLSSSLHFAHAFFHTTAHFQVHHPLSEDLEPPRTHLPEFVFLPLPFLQR